MARRFGVRFGWRRTTGTTTAKGPQSRAGCTAIVLLLAAGAVLAAAAVYSSPRAWNDTHRPRPITR